MRHGRSRVIDLITTFVLSSIMTSDYMICNVVDEQKTKKCKMLEHMTIMCVNNTILAICMKK